VTRGDIYRTRERTLERGNKPGFYVVVSREFIAQTDDVSTVICAPVYSEVLGLATEIIIGEAEGLPRICAVRCDFLTLMFKSKLTHFVAALSPSRIAQMDKALAIALGLHSGQGALV